MTFVVYMTILKSKPIGEEIYRRLRSSLQSILQSEQRHQFTEAHVPVAGQL